MSKILSNFGIRIAELRRKQKLSQEDLAEKANLHRTYIGQVEKGKRNISLKNIEKLALALNVKVNELFKFK